MAAAIADYSPHPTAGKIPSDQEEIVLRLRKNPKLLSRLRTLCGTASTLIGFKLLSNVSSEELIQVAKAQLQTNHLDLCVANDLAHISPDLHPIWIVSADGSVEHASGDKTTIAKALISRVLEYHNQQQQPL
jgi:phosphopantothenate-cysteine ligase